MKKEKSDDRLYKVRCSATFACYAHVTAKDAEDAERKARKWFRDKDRDPVAEASHIHDTYEVEET